MLRFESKGGLGIITLDRLSALNALSKEMILDMYQMLVAWAVDPQVKVVVLRSASDEVFCAGGDVRSVYAMREQSLESKMHFFAIEYHLDYLFSIFKKPIISLMNGLCMGGGVGIGMHVAYPIVGEKIKFSMPETAIGLFPDIGASALLNQMPRVWQNYLGVFAQSLDAEALQAFDLVYGIIPCEKWDNLINELMERHWQEDIFDELDGIFKAYCLPKKEDSLKLPLEDFWRFDCNEFGQLMQHIESAESSDWDAFRQKISKLSPLSMQVTFEQLRRAQGFNLAEALTQDFVLLQHFLAGTEFYEGVRALLIDKDKSPRWTYANWQDVSKEDVMSFFDTKECFHLELQLPIDLKAATMY
jgi:enoyl-CoA hydratase